MNKPDEDNTYVYKMRKEDAQTQLQRELEDIRDDFKREFGVSFDEYLRGGEGYIIHSPSQVFFIPTSLSSKKEVLQSLAHEMMNKQFGLTGYEVDKTECRFIRKGLHGTPLLDLVIEEDK